MTEWWSQRYAAEGAASADGISKQLGQPVADPMTILVREAAQNSWDARLSDSKPVVFRLELRRLAETAPRWRSVLLPGPGLDSRLCLTDGLYHGSYVLVISDRGTRGLGGPLRADQRPSPGVTPDFVQFLRNVGEASDQQHGGGTYGFGKGILYSCSLVRAILVDTNCLHDEGAPRRLMGAALGTSFHNAEGIRHTGRHWWGSVVDDVPYPVTGLQAKALAERVGLPGFADGETGTDIAIIGFDHGETGTNGDRRHRTPRETGQFLVSSILWNLWPKMGSTSRPADMHFQVSVDGEEIRVPEPWEVPELRPFVEALDVIKAGEGTVYARGREPRDAGRIALRATLADARNGATVPQEVSAAMPFTPPSHHVARMRTPELVVDYKSESPHPDQLFAYAGVFLASPAADRSFAISEPPTHDDWVSAGLRGVDRGIVMNLPAFITRAVDNAFPRGDMGLQVSTEGLGRLASRLSGLMLSKSDDTIHESETESVGQTGTARSGSMKQRHRRARLAGPPRVVLSSIGPVVEALVVVPFGHDVIQVDATAEVSLGNGVEALDGAPVGTIRPEVLGWVDPFGVWHKGSTVVVSDAAGGTWTVRSRHLSDAAIRISVGSRVMNDA